MIMFDCKKMFENADNGWVMTMYVNCSVDLCLNAVWPMFAIYYMLIIGWV